VGHWRHGLDDMVMRARRVILDRLEWTQWSRTRGGRFVSGSAPNNAELRHSNVSSSASSYVLPNPHVHLATRCGPRYARSFREWMTCRCSDYDQVILGGIHYRGTWINRTRVL